MKKITLESKIFDLLDENADMKDILIDISSKFKKLNKPIIGETLAQESATLGEMAVVVGMKPIELLNKLREAIGQEPVKAVYADVATTVEEQPEWSREEVTETIDASKLLRDDLSPLVEVLKMLEELKGGELLTITSFFQPQPLIDDLLKMGHSVYAQKVASEDFITYVMKKKMNKAKDFKEAGLSPYLDGTQSPRRYFLIATQLPFFIESCVKHSDSIGLDKETLKEIRGLMSKTKPQVVDNATIVKRMELEAINKMVDDKCSADEVDELFVKIANQQLLMQRIHAKCINEVQAVLNDEQYAKLIEILKLDVEND